MSKRTVNIMTIYENAAKEAIKMYRDGSSLDLEEIWENAVSKFTTSKNSIIKGCPKGAFLGLCEEGLINGIPAGCYTRNSGKQMNKMYALTAVELLESSPNEIFNEMDLWRQVLDNLDYEYKQPQDQMKIVLVLWNNQLINRNMTVH